jgi:hypothetical protein
MAAIEYGSYYWCVILHGKEPKLPGDSIHLHADEISIDPAGSLIFTSAGRRPAGAEPKQQDSEQGGDSNPKGKEKKAQNDEKEEDSEKKSNMIYVAFAPGAWKMVYAAKLADGSPASVEHWNSAEGTAAFPPAVPPNSGASGLPFASRE